MWESLKPKGLMIFSMRDNPYWDDNDESEYKKTIDKMVADKKIKFSKRLIYNKNEGMTEESGTGLGILVEQPGSIHMYRKL